MTGQPTPGSRTRTDGAAPDAENQADLNDSAAVMSELLSDAASPVKEVLQVYDQSLGYEDNLMNIESLDIASLEATAVFLGQEVRCGPSNVQRYRSVRTLADWVIMRIKGLFPQKCLECSESYIIRRSDKPPARCNYCGGGLHNCPAILAEARAATGAKSRVWMCSGCLSKHTLDRFTSHLPGDADGSALDPTHNSTRRGSERDQVLGSQSNEPTPQASQDEPRVCKFYLQRKCRHGRNGTKMVNGRACRNSHPPLVLGREFLDTTT